MRYALSVAALAAVASATPVAKRQAITDADILNYALTLEHLESTFYRQGLQNFTQQQFIDAGFADPFYANLQELAYDEKTHVDFLTTALTAAGAPATGECTYAFGTTTPESFVAVASVLEGVGVSAYLGAAASISTPAYLTAAGSILTVEARHSAVIRSELKEAPFPQPFDIPLGINEVYTLAAAFIVSCPASNPALPVKAFPTLALGTTGTIKSGSEIEILTPGYTLAPKDGANVPIYAAFFTVTGPIFADATPIDGGFKVVVPAGINGQNYAVLTACKDKNTPDQSVAAGPVIVEVTNDYPTKA